MHGEVAVLPVVFLASLFFPAEVTLTSESTATALKVAMETEHSFPSPSSLFTLVGDCGKKQPVAEEGRAVGGGEGGGKASAPNRIIPVQSGSLPSILRTSGARRGGLQGEALASPPPPHKFHISLPPSLAVFLPAGAGC